MKRFCFAVLILMLPTLMSAVDRNTARSMVITKRGIVATSHTLASQAGAEVLARGGSAIDAAITANAVLGVTEPMMNGIGGDLFLLYWDAKSQKLYGLNSSGWAPRGLSIAELQKRGITTMPHFGVNSVTVPGAVEGWSAAHKRFGRLPWRELFQPAIYYAQNGYPVPEVISGYWHENAAKFSNNAELSRVYMINGKIPQVGDLFHNPELAHAYQLIADQGRDAFYKGAIAEAILATSKKEGGTMEAADLADFAAEWVEPISTDYRGWRVYELPPNGQGMAALEMLNILAASEPTPMSAGGPSSAAELHKKIEAMKLAYADLYRYNADPRFAKVPFKGIISPDYGRERAKQITDRADCSPQAGTPPMSDTTYLTVVDSEGSIASLIQSNYEEFGSGVVVEGMGFVLQDRGALFTMQADHPNALAPRKRPFHTIIPAFMEKGDVHIGFGIMGGANQPTAHVQFVSNVVDYGMNIQQALEAPRFTAITRNQGCKVPIEDRIPAAVLDELRAKGHEFDVRGHYSTAMGRGQAVIHNSATGVNYGASDPRADGSAEPEPLPSATPPRR